MPPEQDPPRILFSLELPFRFPRLCPPFRHKVWNVSVSSGLESRLSESPFSVKACSDIPKNPPSKQGQRFPVPPPHPPPPPLSPSPPTSHFLKRTNARLFHRLLQLPPPERSPALASLLYASRQSNISHRNSPLSVSTFFPPLRPFQTVPAKLERCLLHSRAFSFPSQKRLPLGWVPFATLSDRFCISFLSDQRPVAKS